MSRPTLACQDRCCAHCGAVLIEAAALTDLERAENAEWDFLCLPCDRAASALERDALTADSSLVDAF